MKYQDLVLYVMSGTGNTYRAAQWVKETAEAGGCSTQVLMIDEVTPENRPDCRKERLSGVMFPAHGLMAPWSMLKFLLGMPRGRGCPAVSIATRGGIKLGRIIIPGAVGLGNLIAAVILLFKGYRFRGWFSLDMPVNMINLHWGMKPENVRFVLDKARNRLEPVVRQMLDGRRVFHFRNTLWELIWGFGLLWLIPVFPVLYLLIGKLFMAKLMFADNRCIGCGLCARFCPNQGIVMKTIGGRRRPFWTYHCEACLRCMGYCRQNAIEAGHAWGVLLYFATTVPLVTWALKRLGIAERILPEVSGYWTGYLIQAVDVIPAMLIAYWPFWFLTGIPVVNTLFSRLTLTRYFRRYHEPQTRLKDLRKKKRS